MTGFLVLDAGQGTVYDFGGARFVMKASGAETGGQFAVMEMLCPAALDVPPHVHDGEDEVFSVLSGELAEWGISSLDDDNQGTGNGE